MTCSWRRPRGRSRHPTVPPLVMNWWGSSRHTSTAPFPSASFPPKDPKEEEYDDDAEEEGEEALLRDAVRDAKSGRVAKLRGAKKWAAARRAAADLIREYPGDIKALAEVTALRDAIAGLDAGAEGCGQGEEGGEAARRVAACVAA